MWHFELGVDSPSSFVLSPAISFAVSCVQPWSQVGVNWKLDLEKPQH